jgi:hypothetical protein
VARQEIARNAQRHEGLLIAVRRPTKLDLATIERLAGWTDRGKQKIVAVGQLKRVDRQSYPMFLVCGYS